MIFSSIFLRVKRKIYKLLKEGRSKLLAEIFWSVVYGRSLFNIMRDLTIILAF